jgi:hypothetical protein
MFPHAWIFCVNIYVGNRCKQVKEVTLIVTTGSWNAFVQFCVNDCAMEVVAWRHSCWLLRELRCNAFIDFQSYIAHACFPGCITLLKKVHLPSPTPFPVWRRLTWNCDLESWKCGRALTVWLILVVVAGSSSLLEISGHCCRRWRVKEAASSCFLHPTRSSGLDGSLTE